MRIALGIAYNGKNFYGWQRQPELITIQQILEQALSSFSKENIRLYVAGRTDTGVHALEQVVHFETNCIRNDFSWVRGVNTILHKIKCKDINILWATKVTNNFHARFSAVARTYNYILYAGNTKPAIFAGQVGYITLAHGELNAQQMQIGANFLLGQHDFSSFRASICQAKTPIKIIHDIKVKAQHPWYVVSITANAFLHHMVRNIMGCLIKIGLGKQPSYWIEEVLQERNRIHAAPTFMADGLYLTYIDYNDYILPQIKPTLPWCINLS